MTYGRFCFRESSADGPDQRLLLVKAVKCGGQMTSDPWDYEWRKAPMKKGKFIKALKCCQ